VSADPQRDASLILSDLQAIDAEIRATNTKLQELSSKGGLLRRELEDARLRADSNLPRATVYTRNERIEVVVARKSKSTVYTRRPGSDPEHVQAWRQSEYQRKHGNGAWHPYPKSTISRWDSRSLLLAESAIEQEPAA
jgi:hypothetical protein